MRVGDMMQEDVLSVDREMPVGRLLDLLTAAHVHAAPVVDPNGVLIGIVTQEDILVGGLGLGGGEGQDEIKVEDIMTAPAMSAGPDTDLVDVARMMWRFRLHHLPIVDDNERVIGIVSSIDFCRQFAGERLDGTDGPDTGEEPSAG